MRRRCALALAVAVAAAAPAPAAADEHDVRVPAGAAVVAGPTPSGIELVAFGRGSELCVAIRDPHGDGPVTCDEPPERASRPLDASGFGHFDPTTPAGAFAGAVAADVARVDLRFAVRTGSGAGRRVRTVGAATVAGEAYAGPGAGRVRFYLVEGPRRLPWLRLYADAGGRALFAVESPFQAPHAARPVTLARRGAHRLRVVRKPRLAATPLDRGRLVTEICVVLTAAGDDDAGVCATPDYPLEDDLHAATDRGCRDIKVAVAVSARVRRVQAVLGDGRRARVPLVAAPAELGPGARVGGLAIGRGIALRRVEALDAAGRRVGRMELRLAPARPCSESDSVSLFAYERDRRPVGGPLVARARDDGVRLCFALGDLAADGSDCALPPLWAEDAWLSVRRAEGRVLVGGVLPAEVAEVQLTVDGVERRFPTTGDLPGYGGQYRDLVRFASVELPGGARLGAGALLDARGQVLSGLPVVEFAAPPVLARRSLTLSGLPLRVELLGGWPGIAPPAPCVRTPGRGWEQCAGAHAGFVRADALCAPRRVVVVGALPRGARAVVRSDAGAIRPRVVRVGRHRVFVAVLAPRERLRSVAVRGRAGVVRRARLSLPAAAQQCGYGALEWLGRRRSAPGG